MPDLPTKHGRLPVSYVEKGVGRVLKVDDRDGSVIEVRRTDTYRTLARYVGDTGAERMCSWCDRQTDPKEAARFLIAAAGLGRDALLGAYEAESGETPWHASAMGQMETLAGRKF